MGYDMPVPQRMALPGLVGGGFGATKQPQMCHNHTPASLCYSSIRTVDIYHS